MNIYNGLLEEIADEQVYLKKMKLGSEEYKNTVDGLTKQYDRAIAMAKIEIEHKEKLAAQKAEQNLKLKAMKEERIDRWCKNAIAVIGVAVPATITVWGTLVALDFEKTGVITTIAGKGFFGRLIPKK